MDCYTISQGAALSIDVTLRDVDGAIITTYDGSQGLTATVWPGGNRAASFEATATWTVAADGTLRIAIDAGDTANLAPGRYHVLLRLNDAGAPVDAYAATIDV